MEQVRLRFLIDFAKVTRRSRVRARCLPSTTTRRWRASTRRLQRQRTTATKQSKTSNILNDSMKTGSTKVDSNKIGSTKVDIPAASSYEVCRHTLRCDVTQHRRQLHLRWRITILILSPDEAFHFLQNLAEIIRSKFLRQFGCPWGKWRPFRHDDLRDVRPWRSSSWGVTIRGSRHPVSAMTTIPSTVGVKELKSIQPSSSKCDLCSNIALPLMPLFSNEIEKEDLKVLIAIQTFHWINQAWTPWHKSKNVLFETSQRMNPGDEKKKKQLIELIGS